MTKTENYQLNQWDLEDRVTHTDFNKDNAKIDAALYALEQSKVDSSALASLSTEIASKATATELANLQNTISDVQTTLSQAFSPANLPYTISIYIGNGNTTRTISLSFTPRALFVITEFGYTYSGSAYMGGLVTTGMKISSGISIVTNGFQVTCDGSAQSNKSATVYYYIALK